VSKVKPKTAEDEKKKAAYLQQEREES